MYFHNILKELLPSVYYHYEKYNLSSIKTIKSMLQIGIIIALIFAINMYYHQHLHQNQLVIVIL